MRFITQRAKSKRFLRNVGQLRQVDKQTLTPQTIHLQPPTEGSSLICQLDPHDSLVRFPSKIW